MSRGTYREKHAWRVSGSHCNQQFKCQFGGPETHHLRAPATWSGATLIFQHSFTVYHSRRNTALLHSHCHHRYFPSKHPSTSSTSANLSPVSPLDNIFSLPAEVFSSCLAIVWAVMVGGLYLWPALRYGTGYQTVWEIRPSAETPSSVHWRRVYFQLTRVHSALELFGRCALQTYLLTYLLSRVVEVWCSAELVKSTQTFLPSLP